VWITPGIELKVPPGYVLNLEKTHLFACGINMWKGIKVLDGGRIITSNTRLSNSMIEDAEIAIELDGITAANIIAGQPAIDISRIIFNKNYIGIKISNSDAAVDSLALGINGCVFASRNMPYTTAPSALSWPSSSNVTSSGGLRVPSSPTNGLIPPYNLNSYSQTNNLKLPYNTQCAHIGIKIENIGDPYGFLPTPGVQFGITYLGPITPDFNLFDGLGNGIHVTDASLSTANNVFQNTQQYYYPVGPTWLFGGAAIHQEITTIRNARLKLTALKNTSDGNQFWDCHKGVEATNVFDYQIWRSIFRSTHVWNTLSHFFLLGITSGDIGIEATTNRFDFKMNECEINNVRQGIVFSTPNSSMPFDMTGSATIIGVFAQGFNVTNNYFGSNVLSTSPIPVEYMSDAIVVRTPQTNGWINNTNASYIASNKFNRVYRGIHIDGMLDHPLFIGGNEILIEDDYAYGNPDKAWGIFVENNMGNMAVTNNTLQGQSSVPPNATSLIYCQNNFGIISPLINCNIVTDSKYGFEYSGLNPNTNWHENEMCNNFGGLALTNGAIIGPQGGPWGGNGNLWRSACVWAPFSNWQTFVDNSSAVGSELYVFSPSMLYEPTIHGFTGSSIVYSNGPTVIATQTNNLQDCMVFNPYSPPPSWRILQSTNMEKSPKINYSLLQVFPNPTTGSITFVMPNSKDNLKISVRDVTGKLVMQEQNVSADSGQIDLSLLPASVYFITIRYSDNFVTHKKVIKIE
jgi:hypothetical protein